MLTVGELMAMLSSYPSDAELRVAHQPHWPFSYELSGVVSDNEIRDLQDSSWPDDNTLKVWLVEGALDDTISDAVWRACVKKNAE